jgi:hypothetical protein
MHCELLVPGLFAQGEAMRAAAAGLRLPALEMLLGRGRRAALRAEHAERWLLERFGLADAPLAAGALTLYGAGADPGDALWARADPVHLRLMRDHLALVPGAALELSREEAEPLCETLNRHFGARLELQAVRPGTWCARLAPGSAFEAASPLELAGADVNANLPGGAHAKDWHALLNEVQMLLHQHPVNEAREARGAPTVNSVWLWGAGALPARAAAPWQSVNADDPVALGLARLGGMRHRELSADAAAWLERAPEDGRHLLVLDRLRAPAALADPEACAARLRELEERWFAPLLAALKRGRIGMVTLAAPGGEAAISCETIRADLRRFWRFARPLERYA